MGMDRNKDQNQRGSGKGKPEDAGPPDTTSLLLDQEQVGKYNN